MTGENPLGTILGGLGAPGRRDLPVRRADGPRRREPATRVVCITATRGELGSPDEERWPSGAPLAAVRTAELRSALAILGVTEHHWLDYPDGGCADVDQDEAVRRIDRA